MNDIHMENKSVEQFPTRFDLINDFGVIMWTIIAILHLEI